MTRDEMPTERRPEAEVVYAGPGGLYPGGPTAYATIPPPSGRPSLRVRTSRTRRRLVIFADRHGITRYGRRIAR